ncbi:MAG: diguanylate cyclase [Motiliproteus sp.]
MEAGARRSIGDLSELLHGARTVSHLVMNLQSTVDRKQAFDRVLRDVADRKPYVRTFFVASPTGDILFWNHEGQGPSVRDRYYLQHHLENPDSGFYVSKPLRSKLDDRWIIVASLPIRTESGELKEVVAASISADFFVPKFSQVPVISDFKLGVLTRGGKVIWSNFSEAGYELKSSTTGVTWEGMQGQDSFEFNSPTDGKNYLVAYKKLETAPVLVVATVSEDDVLKGWAIQLIFTAAAILLLLVLNVIIGRRLAADHHHLIKQQLELETMAMSDPLTGLANRRHLREHAELMIGSAKRYQFPVSFLMLDIDYFKRVNDTYGHDVGDEVLKALAALLVNTARDADLPCRLGGEEFGVVLSHSDTRQAYVAAERIREKVKNLSFESDQGPFSISVSIGVAELSKDLDDSLKRADEGLYLAKNNGRDQVVIAATFAKVN